MEILTSILRGALGVVVLLGICYLLSNNRKSINWKLVVSGVLLQVVLAILILKVPFIRKIFDFISSFFVVVLDFTDEGIKFLFSSMVTGKVEPGVVNFVFQVLPTIIFFAALSSVLYYFGILQLIIKGFAWLMNKTMKLTGAESLAAAANVFIGQTEAPLVIKPYLEGMSKSEILCLMTGGMATIAGSVFAAYVGFLGGSDEATRQLFATHLLTASIMSAPAAIVAAKMLFPETRDISSQPQKIDVPRKTAGTNFLDAISTGTTDGLKLAVNVGAMLLVFTAFVAMLNYILLHFVGSWTGLNEYAHRLSKGQFEGFNLEFILGLLFSPVAWILGVSSKDTMLVGQLLGLKTTLNEFYAYATLEGLKESMSPKSLLITTYALCGFANFASIGIQIGGISAIAPGQRRNLTALAVKALIGGTVASFLTAAIAGVLIG